MNCDINKFEQLHCRIFLFDPEKRTVEVDPQDTDFAIKSSGNGVMLKKGSVVALVD